MNDFMSYFLISYFSLGLFFGIIAGLNSWAELIAKGNRGWKPIALGISVGIGMTILWFPVAMIIGWRMLITK